MKIILKKSLIVLAVVFCMIMSIVSPLFTFTVSAAVTSYSGALEDLQKDSSFNSSVYVSDPTNNDLQIVQVAEGANGEIFVYVFNPAHETRDLKAAKINMALDDPTKRDIVYSLYDLTWLNTTEKFSKYVVNGATVKEEEYRYYSIATVYRAHDASIDDPALDGDDIVNYEGMPVGQSWKVSTYNGNMIYEAAEMEYADVEIQSVGFTRYSNGFHLYNDSCDAHFIAFSVSNFDVDAVYDATVRYTYQDYEALTGLGGYEIFGDLKFLERDVSYVEEGSNNPNGFLGIGNYNYTWNRIQSTEEFIKETEEQQNEYLTDTDKENLSKSQFVIRFLETDYKAVWSDSGTFVYSTKVTQVTLLRLHFLSGAKTYNLGVVADIVSDDGVPDYVVTLGDNIQNGFEDVALILGLILLAIIIFFLRDPIWALIKLIGEGLLTLFEWLLMIVTFPIRLIAWFFK